MTFGRISRVQRLPHTVGVGTPLITSSIAKQFLPEFAVNGLRRIRDRRRFRRIGIRVTPETTGVEYLGTRYGGYAIPISIMRDGTALCLGAGEDISFEVALAQCLNAKVHIFDPTPRSILYCNSLIAQLKKTVSDSSGSLMFHPFGVWSVSKAMRFYEPMNPSDVSHSIVNMQHTKKYFEAECWTPREILGRLAIDQLSLLKLNIEGAEYEVMGATFDSGIFPAAVCITFDELHTPIDGGATRRLTDLVGRFVSESYIPIRAVDCKATFVRKDVFETIRSDRSR